MVNKFSYGVSFSAKYARELGLEPKQVYLAILRELNFARVRLMSYWDDIETSAGVYNFDELDWQIKQAQKHQVNVTLCLGMRQPRWPECHMPGWTKQLSQPERHQVLYAFIEQVVNRYKDQQIIESWQLENEAQNKGFGLCDDYSRQRLRTEFRMVKSLDPTRPIIMSTSNTVAVQIRQPRPDIIGFSVYLSQYRNGKYYFSRLPVGWYKLRKCLATLLRRPTIIHELQAEPWGPDATHKLSLAEQAKSMDPEKLRRNIAYAQKIGIKHIDLWGGEWWYWQKIKYGDSSYWNIIKNLTS